jgi:hypothetical protein
MPRSTASNKASIHVKRWWLSGDDAECPHCGMLYAYEVEYRCPDCDEPTCMNCVVLHAERRVCPSCVSVPKKKQIPKRGR